MKLALIQNAVGDRKSDSLEHARTLVLRAAQAADKPDLIVLPECFATPYDTQAFEPFSEPLHGGPTCAMLSEVAAQTQTPIVGGSFPERSGEQIFNTCPIFDSQGTLLAAHRKVHLFDIDIPGRIRFRESDVLSAGNGVTAVAMADLGFSIGVGICFDVRFAELALATTRAGDVKLMVYPGAFNLEATGPAHWELVARSRALDVQTFVAMCSPARSMTATYHAWGHSIVVDPWGDIVAQAGHDETILNVSLDLGRVDAVRAQLPVRAQRRHDLFALAQRDD